MAVQDIIKNASLATEQRTVIYPYLREVFINEAPVVTRAHREAAAGVSYSIDTYDVRARTKTLTSAIVTGDSTITLNDTTSLVIGDILELINTAGSAVERLQVTALPSSTTATITRAMSGTTAIANDTTGGAANNVVKVIGTSKFGSEVDTIATRATRTLIPQYVQSFLLAAQMSRLANQVQNTALPPGIASPFDLEQQTKMTELVRDEEYTLYFGMGEAPSTTVTAKCRGIKQLIGYYNGGSSAPALNSNVNVKLAAGGSYTFLNFVADGIQKAIDGGGDPDTIICSTNFLGGLNTWGYAKSQIIEPRTTKLGVPIAEITVPLASKPITIIPSYQMPAGTACVLTWRDLLVRYIAEETWLPRAIRGQAIEGEYYADLCPELGHPGWHAWVEGITSFA
jgi:hypothetical protein